MEKIQAAVFDVDGTLFDYRDRKIHDSTVEAVEKLKAMTPEELGVPEDLPQGGVKRAEHHIDVYASSFPRNFFACK